MALKIDLSFTSDRLALACIRMARRLTHWGFVDDHLSDAEASQLAHMQYTNQEGQNDG